MTNTTKNRIITSLNEPETQFKKKILIVGDGGVGKTSFINKHFNKHLPFEKRYIPTKGIKTYTFNQYIIFDFPGQELYGHKDIKNKIGEVDLVMIMYDLTSKISHCNIRRWKNYISEHYGDIPIILVGNKADITGRIKIKNEKNMVSAKTGSNLQSVFANI